MAEQEKHSERYLRAEIERLGGVCIKFPPLFLRGFPDRIILMKRGVIAFVEMKREGEEPKPMQWKWITKLRRMGFKCEVLHSREEIDAFVMLL